MNIRNYLNVATAISILSNARTAVKIAKQALDLNKPLAERAVNAATIFATGGSDSYTKNTKLGKCEDIRLSMELSDLPVSTLFTIIDTLGLNETMCGFLTGEKN